MAPQLKQLLHVTDIFVPSVLPEPENDQDQSPLHQEAPELHRDVDEDGPRSYLRMIRFEAKVLDTIDESSCVSDDSDHDGDGDSGSQKEETHFFPEALRRPSVRFDPVVRHCTVLNLDDFTDEEVDATWYGPEELDSIRQECIYTIHLMMECQSFDEDAYCARGLEYKTASGARIRRRNKQIAVTTVLEEQELQRSEGIEDPEYLAEAYRHTSENSKRVSHRMALRDAEVAALSTIDKLSVSELRKPSSSSEGAAHFDKLRSTPSRPEKFLPRAA